MFTLALSGWWGSWWFYFSYISVDTTIFYHKYCFYNSPKELFLKWVWESFRWEPSQGRISAWPEVRRQALRRLSNARLPHSSEDLERRATEVSFSLFPAPVAWSRCPIRQEATTAPLNCGSKCTYFGILALFSFLFLLTTLGFELRASLLLGRYSTAWATPLVYFCSGFSGDWVLQTIFPGWPQTEIL
jgi:hypothetical protein